MKRTITQIFTLLLLVTLAAPAFAGRVLAEIEYFYADDGTLIGKAFNGKLVNFEYDLRGQLLAVKDAQGKDLERYTYDPAGNRLSKTINGVTTTYTSDKANQLVTSTVNGITTHYKYDAAGRMIQAGDKSYIYNGQNKVSEVRQNGKTIAKFEYNIDGQIAKAIYGNKVEEFMWDGLALIWRSGVTYINEPYVTGGNPVMAGDNVLFNDMLGSTLAVNDKAVEMTSFGETTDKNAFFTGKPMIDELGYSFLFRDYNPNQGKWTTSDPLGYPDGWNNLAYCNNGVTLFVDWLGALIVTDAIGIDTLNPTWGKYVNAVIDAVIVSNTAGGNMILQAKNNPKHTITVSESNCKEVLPGNRWPHCEPGTINTSSSTVHIGLYEYQQGNKIWNPIDGLIHELLHGADIMSNGCATLDDQQINKLLAEIRKNPQINEKLNNILKTYPPKGRYNRDTGVLTVYE